MNIVEHTDDTTPYACELNSSLVGGKLETESATIFECFRNNYQNANNCKFYLFQVIQKIFHVEKKAKTDENAELSTMLIDIKQTMDISNVTDHRIRRRQLSFYYTGPTDSNFRQT